MNQRRVLNFILHPSYFILSRCFSTSKRLVDKSLAIVDLRSGEARYRMLETIREYALERLRESGDEERVRECHTAWYLDFAVRAREHIDGPDQAGWMERLQTEYDNLRAVLRRAASSGDWLTVARLGHALFQFWTTRGYWSEGRDTLLPALESGYELPPPVLAGALYTLGCLETRRTEYAAAEVHFERALAIRRELGDPILTASTMRMLGTVYLRKGEVDRATELFEEVLAVYREAGDELRMAWAFSGLGLAAMDVGDLDRARARMEESLALSRKTGGHRHAASALHNLGEIMYRMGDLVRAEQFGSECLELSIELDDRQLTSFTYALLGNVAAGRGDLAYADGLYTKALAMSRELGDTLAVATTLESMAAASLASGDARRALDQLDEAAAMRALCGLAPTATEQVSIEATRSAAAELVERGT
jgi:non-specific serine/threonine protein kinase